MEGLWLRLRELPITKVAEGLGGRRDKKSGRGRTAAVGVEGEGSVGGTRVGRRCLESARDTVSRATLTRDLRIDRKCVQTV